MISISQKWRWLSRTAFPAVPVIGPLSRCTRQHHFVAIKEFLITLCFSTSTFWLTALLLRAFMQTREAQPLMLLYQTVNSGQLFIFSVGFLGPILITAGDDPPLVNVFPDRTRHFHALILLATIGAGLYAMHLCGMAASTPSIVDD